MDLMEKPKEWLWHVAAKKVGAAIVGGVTGFLARAAVATTLQKFGVTVDPATLTAEITTSTAGAAVWLHDLLKLKYGDTKWGRFLL